ncbi:MAG: terminase large subunit domain-containing protein [Roseiarcus sp.]
MNLRISILDALDDPALLQPHFRGPSWTAWRGFLAALFALESNDSGEAYRAATGRQSLPEAPFSEAALIVGRRGGKSRILALIAVCLACFRDYTPYLAPGEVATIAVLAANRQQARSIFRYVSGLLKAVPLFAPMIAEETADSITLSNRVVIEIGTASFRTTRGYSFAAVLCDEIAFWRQDETSANPDVEILRALRPGMASIPGSILLLASSPYAKRGELYGAFRRHFGKDAARVLVWKADTATMNPRIDPAIIAEAYESDPEAARAEYGAEFRDDLADFVTREIVEAVTAWGRTELPPEPGVTYSAFCDPSGGANDAMTLAVAHLRDGEVCVLDAVLEVRPPFDPERAVAECACVLRRFGVTRIIGDRYAGEWPKARFREHGITFEQSARPKSDLYHDLLPLLNAKRVELLENTRLAAQLVGLERRTARSGRDSIDHTPGGHDDVANAVAGVLVGLDLDRRPALVRQSDVLENGSALPLPTNCKHIVSVMVADTADKLKLIGLAQAAMTVSTKTTPPPEESAEHRALRLAAKRFRDLLIAERDYQLEAARKEYDIAEFIEGRFDPVIAAAKEFAEYVPMTAIGFIAAKMMREIELINRNHKPAIPLGLGDDGLIVVMTRAALAHTHIDPLPSREAIGKHLRRAARR